MAEKQSELMEKIISLCKRRGFVFPGSEIYGGLANSWDYGPYGVTLKNNIKQLWWKRFVSDRDDMVGLDSSLLLNTKVWEASGHLGHFTDPLVEDKKTHERYRLDHLLEEQGISVAGLDFDAMAAKMKELGLKSPKGNELTEPKQFNMMMKTHLGPTGDESSAAYFRPETAQGIFINFKNVVETARKKLPFGVGQIGKAFRNEITPGNFIFRTREFEQMEIEYFIPEPKDDAEWQAHFEAWKQAIISWIKELGIDYETQIHELDVPKDELAHYSKKTIDFEFHYPFGVKELYGLAYRYDFDLNSHKLDYVDAEGKKYVPHVIEPSMGVERTLLAVLLSAYKEEVTAEASGDESEASRVVLKLPVALAPVKVAVFPLLKNKPDLVAKAREVYDTLRKTWPCEFDDNGNVGKRYRRQDEIGTPFCITVDFDTLENNEVTVRDRDTMKQEHVSISNLETYLRERLA
jgi:glycyl-tRNA synthetase